MSLFQLLLICLLLNLKCIAIVLFYVVCLKLKSGLFKRIFSKKKPPYCPRTSLVVKGKEEKERGKKKRKREKRVGMEGEGGESP